VTVFEVFRRWVIESQRSEAWNKASKDWKKAHPSCAMCGIKKNLEAHDKLPYHLLTDAQKNDYGWLYGGNFITLCFNCHRQIGHCGDPNCMEFNPKIEQIVSSVSRYRKYCRK
jgi:hypothetical protein